MKRKIAISFNVSALVILLLVVFEYANFHEIKKEIKYLENTDQIRSKSLQLRRREARFFLYGAQDARQEADMVHQHLDELNELIKDTGRFGNSSRLEELQSHLHDYSRRFSRVEKLFDEAILSLNQLKPALNAHAPFFPLMESFIRNYPNQSSALLKHISSLPASHKLVITLSEIEVEIKELRKTGEDILLLTGELDKVARENVEGFILRSETAIMVMFPLFLLIGIGALFLISTNVVNRLMALIRIVESTGKGNFAERVPSGMLKHDDEVGTLIKKLNEMEDHLAARDCELRNKNDELLQTKKLAAIGTFASGVAHEINNPLNNINISAQVLAREAQRDCTGKIYDIVQDIVGQIARVKHLVNDLLDFARGKAPVLVPVDATGLIRDAYICVAEHFRMKNIQFELTGSSEVIVDADQLQMERVFINLFSNAIEAMPQIDSNVQGFSGHLKVSVEEAGSKAIIRVSDNGSGIRQDCMDQIFEPFFTTKHRGTGLGLSIVFSIINKHHGQISVDSEEGRGTVFTIILPRSHSNEIQDTCS
ncbi:MAG: GHKL domain-containing protein [Nitrospiraceae bacterium]|nr:GHKL domain-containing protein [Nitrospiraceae bacterium]